MRAFGGSAMHLEQFQHCKTCV